MKKKIKKNNSKWILIITILAFLISLIFSFLTEILMPNVNILIALLLIFIFIGLGILFDIIGVSVTSADERPFHAMSSKKVRGAKIAVKFKKNADRVSSFCNDVIGDICGIVSGSAGVYVALKLSEIFRINNFIMSLLITSIIASLTIGGKALGKGYAINNSTKILTNFSKFISYFYDEK